MYRVSEKLGTVNKITSCCFFALLSIAMKYMSLYEAKLSKMERIISTQTQEIN